MYTQEYMESVRARAIAALHTRHQSREFIEIAEKFIANAMPYQFQWYTCQWCRHVICKNCGRCHMINRGIDEEKTCSASNPRRKYCPEWEQAYYEVQAILETDAKKEQL
jgi:hypothetical protein